MEHSKSELEFLINLKKYEKYNIDKLHSKNSDENIDTQKLKNIIDVN